MPWLLAAAALEPLMETKNTKRVDLADASLDLAALIKLARQGTEVVITDAGVPLARLVDAASADQPRIAGLNEGEVWISDDFDGELPDEFWLGKE
jgi:prevent-host-death family protein